MRLLISLLLLASALYGDIKSEALSIEKNYESFIDTPPSQEKQQYALKTKKLIVTFEKKYPTSELLPTMMQLLKQVDFNLKP